MKIQNETEHQAALKEIAPFFEPHAEPLPGSAEEAHFLELGYAIEEYERNLWLSVPEPNLPPW